MSDPILKGDRVIVFDPILWAGKDLGDNSQYWKPATVLKVYRDNGRWTTGDWVVDVVFDHRPAQISHGHFTTFIRRETK